MVNSSIDGGTAPEVLQCDAWQSLSWLVHGFSQRRGGTSVAYGEDELNLGFTIEDDRAHVLENRERLMHKLMGSSAGLSTPGNPPRKIELVTLQQIHSAIVHRTSDGLPVEAGDGMMTAEAGKLLAILTADCVPVLVIDRRQKAVAAFHAGWRGTVHGIVQAGLAKMKAELGSRPEDLSAAIGPCIGACCYEVGEEVRQQFSSRCDDANTLFSVNAQGGRNLDLVEANRRQLLQAGLAAEDIHALQQCTACQPERFFSHRKSSGRAGRMMSVIGIRPD